MVDKEEAVARVWGLLLAEKKRQNEKSWRQDGHGLSVCAMTVLILDSPPHFLIGCMSLSTKCVLVCPRGIPQTVRLSQNNPTC